MSEDHLLPENRQAARRLSLSLFLTLGFVAVETIAGLWSNSLALLTDAAHNATDVMALALSWFAMRLALRPAGPKRTYGYQRAGILAAMVNSLSLMVISIGIFIEAYRRLVSPPEIQAGVLMAVGALAFLINLFTAWLVHQGSDRDLNLRSAFVHLMGDVLSTLGAVAAGVLIHFTGWNVLDALVSLLIGLLILWNAWGILRETLDILLESAPHDLDLKQLLDDLKAVPGVRGVHHLHVWSITRSLRALSAHILTDDIKIAEGASIRAHLTSVLADRYGISHATLQLECVACPPEPLCCNLPEACSTCSEGD